MMMMMMIIFRQKKSEEGLRFPRPYPRSNFECIISAVSKRRHPQTPNVFPDVTRKFSDKWMFPRVMTRDQSALCSLRASWQI